MIRFAFRKLFGIITFIRFGSHGCLRCWRHWSVTQWHSTPGGGVWDLHPLCVDCWADLTPARRLPYYRKLHSLWLRDAPMDAHIPFMEEIEKAVELEGMTIAEITWAEIDGYWKGGRLHAIQRDAGATAPEAECPHASEIARLWWVRGYRDMAQAKRALRAEARLAEMTRKYNEAVRQYQAIYASALRTEAEFLELRDEANEL